MGQTRVFLEFSPTVVVSFFANTVGKAPICRRWCFGAYALELLQWNNGVVRDLVSQRVSEVPDAAL